MIKIIYFSDPNGISKITTSQDGKYIVVGSHSGTLTIYEWTNQKKNIILSTVLSGHRNSINNIAVDSNFSIIVSSDLNGKILSWDINLLGYRKELFSLEPVNKLIIHPLNGDIIASSKNSIIDRLLI